jgi:hypothetical protein
MHNIFDVIKNRKSVRTYSGEALSADDLEIINQYLANEENLIGPFGNRIRIEYKIADDPKSKQKIGTYGVISGAPAFLIVICPRTREALVDCGYVLERLILLLTLKKMGTCWLAGTFTRKNLNVSYDLDDTSIIPAITPIGYALETSSFKDGLVRKIAKSDERKDFNELFFYQTFHNKVMSLNNRKVLEAIRLAPSASNKQPWRVVLTDDGATHFYLSHTPGSSTKKLGFDVQLLDMGIAIAHYMSVTGFTHYTFDKPNIKPLSDAIEYILTLESD